MAIDPILSLTISVHSNPSVYAVLLGSGVSRASGIPTGWEVVLDLIRKIASINDENCEPDPEAWYKNKYGEEPNYSKIIDELAKSPAERSQLLRSYFEPNEKELEEGLKVPTVAHKAISELVAKGYIKVIITTNFDRLLENALEKKGIIPTVISTTDSIKGALPLTHTKCTLLKVHGDYIDTRIKNTPTELESYDKPLNQLLDQIFDEFGLIICGWSAEWDRALYSALEKCKSHRFTTYWTLKEEPTDVTKKLIQLRRAEIIKINDADSFFVELEQKVSSLYELDRPHPLSSKVAAATIKRYLTDERFKIQLHDLVFQEANRLHEEFSGDEFSLNTAFNLEEYKSRVLRYESSIEILLRMFIVGCYWGRKSHEQIWAKCLERINVPRKEGSWIDIWFNLKFYPSLILLYTGGISSIIANHYNNFAALFSLPKYSDERIEIPLALKLAPNKVIRKSEAEIIFNKKNYRTPLNDHLQQLLRETLREYLPDENEYIKIFDKFEYLFALIYADLHEKQYERIWGPPGCFLWRNRDEPERHIINKIKTESSEEGDNWPPIKAGLFDGSFERFQYIEKEFINFLKQIPYF